VTAERKFECQIDSPLDDESAISRALEKALPSLEWGEGDSSWDKVRVLGERPDVFISVYRYESPGSFRLQIVLRSPDVGTDEREYLALRDKVLVALRATVCIGQ
jgi:hypothetical protein